MGVQPTVAHSNHTASENHDDLPPDKAGIPQIRQVTEAALTVSSTVVKAAYQAPAARRHG